MSDSRVLFIELKATEFKVSCLNWIKILSILVLIFMFIYKKKTHLNASVE